MNYFKLSAMLPLALTVFGGLIYHSSSKNVPNINPAFLLMMAYVLQTIICVSVLTFMPTSESFISSARSLNYWVIGLAIGSILMEVGFILAYRAGWKLSSADITSVTILSLAFLGIEVMAFNLEFSLKKWLAS